MPLGAFARVWAAQLARRNPPGRLPAKPCGKAEEERGLGAEQNIETVKAMYDAFGRGDVQAILERVTDDVDWSTDAAIESAPWYGHKTR